MEVECLAGTDEWQPEEGHWEMDQENFDSYRRVGIDTSLSLHDFGGIYTYLWSGKGLISPSRAHPQRCRFRLAILRIRLIAWKSYSMSMSHTPSALWPRNYVGSFQPCWLQQPVC